MLKRWVSLVKQHYAKYQVATLFLLVALVFGPLFILLVPPTQAADETTHFHRAYQLSEGGLFSGRYEQGYAANLPRAVYETSTQLFADIPSHYDRTFNYRQVASLLKRKVNNNERVMVHHETSAVYSPIGYVPQIIAIRLLRLVWPSPMLMYYVCRLVDFVVWLGLMYITLRLWGSGKWAVFTLALTPMSLSQAATASPDGLTNAAAFVTIALVLYAVRNVKRLSSRHIAIAVTIAIGLALAKPIFFIFSFLSLLFSPKQLGGRRKYWLFVGGLIGGALLVALVWNSLVKDYTEAIAYYYYPDTKADSAKQLWYIATHPIDFMLMLFRTYFSSVGDQALRSFIGRLGWWDTDLPLWTVFSSYILLGLALLTRTAKQAVYSTKVKRTLGGIFILGFLTTNVLLYMTITKVGGKKITTIQGRYFIALAPLLIPLLAGLVEIRGWDKLAPKLLPIGSSVILATSLAVLFARFT